MTEKYLQEKEVIIRKEAYPLLAEIDTVIFDIDGVLIDVNASYIQTIIDTVQYYFRHVISSSGDTVLMDKKFIEVLKMMGGFNDDWELAAAAVLYYIWKMKEFELKSLEALKKVTPSMTDFSHENLSDGGGLAKLIIWVKENASCPVEIFALWNREKIFQMAKEFYAGEKHCFRLYHFHPRMVGQAEGNIEKEIMLIRSEITEMVKRYHVGILTGRNQAETKFILEQMGWNSWLPPETIITSEDYKSKPSPEGLAFLMRHFGSEVGLYIGDTMDDLLTVKNLNRYSGKQGCLSGLVLGSAFQDEDGKREYYQKNDVDLLAEDVNQVMKLIDYRSQ